MSYNPNMLTGVYYDKHPETGEPGQWRLFPDQGWVNLDPNAPTGVYWNERGQNYMGELGQYYKVNPNTGEVSIDEDGDGRWYYSGMLGWVNTKPAEVQPDPGAISFGNFDGGLAGPTGESQTTANNTATTTSQPPADTTTNQPPTDTTAMLSQVNDPNAIGSSWLDVLNRQGRDLESWDGFLGTFTGLPENPNWLGMDSNQVQQNFNNIWNQGLFSGLSQNQVYADLLKRLGFA